MDKADSKFRASPQQPRIDERRPVVDVYRLWHAPGSQRRMQRHPQPDGVLGEAEPVADQQPRMIVQEREQIHFPAADLRSVQRIRRSTARSGRRLRTGRTPPRRPPPAGPLTPAGESAATTSTPTEPTPKMPAKSAAPAPPSGPGFPASTRQPSPTPRRRSADRSPARSGPAHRTRPPGSGGSTCPTCPANNAPAFPTDAHARPRRSTGPTGPAPSSTTPNPTPDRLTATETTPPPAPGPAAPPPRCYRR